MNTVELFMEDYLKLVASKIVLDVLNSSVRAFAISEEDDAKIKTKRKSKSKKIQKKDTENKQFNYNIIDIIFKENSPSVSVFDSPMLPVKRVGNCRSIEYVRQRKYFNTKRW
jgi:hypothetical protein